MFPFFGLSRCFEAADSNRCFPIIGVMEVFIVFSFVVQGVRSGLCLRQRKDFSLAGLCLSWIGADYVRAS